MSDKRLLSEEDARDELALLAAHLRSGVANRSLGRLDADREARKEQVRMLREALARAQQKLLTLEWVAHTERLVEESRECFYGITREEADAFIVDGPPDDWTPGWEETQAARAALEATKDA